jgi:phage N-6-adenine-methyltransferase
MEEIKTSLDGSSKEFGTPVDLFNKINNVYNFSIDSCASSENKKLDNYFDVERNGLIQEWNQNTWCNPPYGRGCIEHWINKAVKEHQKYPQVSIGLLIPSRTETKWFSKLWEHGSLYLFFRGRIKFIGGVSHAAWPNVFVQLGPTLSLDSCQELSKLGTVVSKFWGVVR